MLNMIMSWQIRYLFVGLQTCSKGVDGWILLVFDSAL